MVLARFSVDGKRVASAGYPTGIVQVWDTASGRELSGIETGRGHHGAWEYVAFPQDLRTAFVSSDGRTFRRREVDGKTHAFDEYDGEVAVWDLTTRKRIRTIKPEPGRGINDIVVSPDGT